jgi:hypothetical protein
MILSCMRSFMVCVRHNHFPPIRNSFSTACASCLDEYTKLTAVTARDANVVIDESCLEDTRTLLTHL